MTGKDDPKWWESIFEDEYDRLMKKRKEFHPDCTKEEYVKIKTKAQTLAIKNKKECQ